MRLLSRELRAWRPADLTLVVNRLGRRELTSDVAAELRACGAPSVHDPALLAALDRLLLLCFAVAHGRTVARVAELSGLPVRRTFSHFPHAAPPSPSSHSSPLLQN